TYADNGLYTVTVKVTDKDNGAGQATFKVDVANVPPTASLGNNGPVDEGSAATISFSAQSDPSSADTAAGFHYSYDCTAGGSNLASSYATAGTSASSPCTFDDNGVYTVYGRIFDRNNGFSTYTTSVTVNNVPPTASLGNTGPVDEGSPATISFSA